MLIAAFTSALQAQLQATQRKMAWLSRLSGATCPHAEQRWLVNGAGLVPAHAMVRDGIGTCERYTGKYLFMGSYA